MPHNTAFAAMNMSLILLHKPFFSKNKKAVNAAFKKAEEHFKTETVFEDNQIKEFLAKRFKKKNQSVYLLFNWAFRQSP